jgi:hypothetical protein
MSSGESLESPCHHCKILSLMAPSPLQSTTILRNHAASVKVKMAKITSGKTTKMPRRMVMTP